MNRFEPLISILVPCYNNQHYIYELLESVFAQSYHNLEVIIGDDCSESFQEDELIRWIDTHKPEWFDKISIYRNISNLGTVANIENLQQKSAGQYLINIAADDVFYDGTVIESLVDKAYELSTKGEQAEVIMAQVEMWNHELDNKLSDFISPELADMIKNGTSRDLFAQDSIDCRLPAQYLYKRSVLEKIGCLSNRYRLVEDWPSMLRLLCQGVKIHYMDFPPVIKHRDGGISKGNRIHSNQVHFRYLMDLVYVYIYEIEPFEDLLTEEEKRLARKRVCDLIYAVRTIHLDEVNKRLYIPETEDKSIGNRIKNLLKKNAQMKHIWKFLFLTVLFFLFSEHVRIGAVYSLCIAVSCVSLLIASAGIAVKSWIIARDRLHLF